MMHILFLLLLFFVIARLVTRPFRRRGFGYNPYRYGCRRHHRHLGGFLPILALMAIDRLFTRRP